MFFCNCVSLTKIWKADDNNNNDHHVVNLADVIGISDPVNMAGGQYEEVKSDDARFDLKIKFEFLKNVKSWSNPNETKTKIKNNHSRNNEYLC